MLLQHDESLLQYPFLSTLRDNWEMIRDEYKTVIDKRIQWPEQYLHNGQWMAYGLLFKGKWMVNACPRTTTIIKNIPGVWIAGYSILKPGCIIKPHEGYSKEVLRCHLGLSCPEADTKSSPLLCISGSGTTTWHEGKLLVFDDTKTHSVTHRGHKERVILICDFRRPT